MDTTLPDAAARHTALTDLGRTLVVEAGAGTGKTALLTARVAMLLCAGVAPQRIAAITFTEAAASQLAHRIERLVHDLLSGAVPLVLREALPHGLCEAQRAPLQHAARALDHMTITTIHGFCRQILTVYPVEAGLDPGATVIEPAAAMRAFEEHFDAWLRARLREPCGCEPPSHSAPPESMLFLRALASRAPVDTIDLVRRVACALNDHRDARAPRVHDEVAGRAASLGEAIRAFAAWYSTSGLVEPVTAALIDELAHVGEAAYGVVATPRCAEALAAALLHSPPGACRRGERRFKRWQGAARWTEAALASGNNEMHGQALSAAAMRHYGDCDQAYASFCNALAGAATQRIVDELTCLRETLP